MGGQDAPSLVANLRGTVERFPQAEVLADGRRSTSYAELWQAVAAVAAQLRNEGVSRGDHVALLAENSLEFVAGYYGILGAGAVAVVLNPAGRAVEIARLIEHAEARWILIGTPRPDIAELLLALHEGVRAIAQNWPPGSRRQDDLDWPENDLADPAAIEDPADPDALAVILYTSGTTGRPKGVMLSHRNLAANVESIQRYLELGSKDRIVCVLPFNYSYGASVLNTHIRVGASIVIENSLVYPHMTVQRMADEGATGFSGVPSTFALLLKRVNFERYNLSRLRYVTQAGGPMSPEMALQLRAVLPTARLFVMYGQTEAAARLTWLPPERLDEKLGSIGIPIPGVEIEVRTELGLAAATGESGELFARGANVMLGYWRDPEATAAAIQDGWLATGDLGHRDADGFLYLAGRRNEMIKTGAHRIAPVEIEEVLRVRPEVADCAVIGVPDEILGQVIGAFIVPTAHQSIDPLALKAHCRERLAAYKVPKHLCEIARIPRTASGKIQRHLLPPLAKGSVSDD